MKKQDLNGVRTPQDVERRHNLGAIPKLEEEVSDFSVDSALSSSSTHAVQNKVITNSLNSLNMNKVDKVSGKGLSSNDFTNEDKASIHTHSNKNVLDTITQQKMDHWDNNSIEGAFPINKIEIFFDNLDHSNFLGFTWERISEGRFPVGINTNDTDFDTIGETGGEKTHTLTINEMPSHYHTLSNVNMGQANDNNLGGSYPRMAENKTGTTSSVGGNSSHNNLPPYIVMAFWKRVS